GAFNILLPLLDRQGYLSLDESEDAAVVKKGEKVSFIATANIGMQYTGMDEMERALNDGISIIIEMDYPTRNVNAKSSENRCPGIKSKDVSQLIEVASTQRQMCREGDFQDAISTRILIEAASMIAGGGTFDLAVKFCIANHFSAEGGDASERAKIEQICQK